MNVSTFESTINRWGRERTSFLFLIDFEMQNLLAWKSDEIPDEILFSIDANATPPNLSPMEWKKEPLSFYDYERKFNVVQRYILQGDSYLTNLTVKTKIEINRSLEELFLESHAPYKLCWKNKFMVFSPESFVKIIDGRIFSFPMKGTIDASLPNAEQQILADQKELSEHITIVDLIRNDLSVSATDVKVNRFRYVSRIETTEKKLLQVSSEIVGVLSANYRDTMGSLLLSLLPAGSISGAPKKKTLQIIAEAEGEKRGYYTGVFGYFDGQNLDSAVMIRFIEKEGEAFYFRSGGGITAQSNARKEYQEALDKIYVPID